MAKKSKNIDALQRRHARDMLKVYRKRANEVKAALVKVIKSGGDSTVLRQEKAKINNVIKRLNKELNKLARNQVDSSYFDGREESLKDFENLNLDKIDKELGKTKPIPEKELTALTAEYTDHTEWMVRRLNDDVNGFLRNGFDDINQVVNAFNKLTKNQVVMEAPKAVQTTQIKDLKDFSNQILSSQTTREDWAALAKSIEQKFLRRDVFTVPYFNKSKEVVRNVKVKSYAEMLARTMTAQTYRDAAQKAILDKFGKLGDLVEIMGDSDYHECDECKKFEHQILSLTGQTKGYTTIDEAKEQGLFHPNCIHWFEVTDKVLDEYSKIQSQ